MTTACVTTVYRSVVDATALRLIRLGPNLIGAAFGLMKLLPAQFILARAAGEGRLGPRGPVVESRSGTFGLGLALVCAQRGHPLTVVSECIDARLRRRFEDLGARVELVTRPAADGGFQEARLARLRELLDELPGAFWPRQYDNPDNPRAYSALVAQLVESVGRVGAVVGTVGSGGSMCGTARFLRALFGPDVQAVGVGTHGSVHFRMAERPRLLGGPGSSTPMGNVNHRAFDAVHWVTAAEAYAATRELHRRHGLFMGPTSGAAFLVARWYAERHSDRQVVTILPDEGHRYTGTAYDDAWLRAQGAPVGSPGRPGTGRAPGRNGRPVVVHPVGPPHAR